MSIYDDIDPIAYADLYQSIYPDWKGRQDLLDLLGQNPQPGLKPVPDVEIEPLVQTELPVPVTEVAIQGIVEDAPDSEEEYIDFTPDERVPLKCDTEAKLMGYFCSTLQDRLQQSESKGREWELITAEYNNGSLAEELYALKGKRTERALRIWLARYEQSKQDMYALLHGNRYQKRQRKITELEGKVLLAILLHPNRISIGSALKLLKAKA
ncbi:MAG: hypothetical protein RBS43_11795, partial [Candidatus Cloacimonas sp.]|nr:hypothetical protein [Candidatus Cloacimonas sp.]